MTALLASPSAASKPEDSQSCTDAIPASHVRRGGSMSQRCDPHGPGCYYRCPICGQWWCYDPRDGFWESISMIKMFFLLHNVWRQERKHRKATHGRTD